MVPAQTPEPTFRTTVSEVQLDVVVRDKNQHIIRNLRPDEVQVFENGVRQQVRHFEFVDGRTVVQEPVLQARQPAAAATPATSQGPTVNQLRDMSVVSIVIASLDPRGRKLTEKAIQDFVKDELTPRTYIGVFWLGMGGMVTVQPYTNDAQKIANGVKLAVDRVSFASPAADLILPKADNGTGSNADTDPLNGVQAPQQGGAQNGQAFAAVSGPAAAIAALNEAAEINELHDVYQDSMHYLMPLLQLARVQSLIPGRKVVLMFSAGLPVHADTAELLQNVISTANKSNVTFYSVDTRDYTDTLAGDLDFARSYLGRATEASRRQQLAAVSGGDMTVTPSEVLSAEYGENSVHANTRGNMMQLAEGTGGELLPPSLDLKEPLRRAMEDVHTHYELSYSPSDTSTDGTFRKIQVRVTRKGAQVFTRSGYYALPTVDGQQVYPFEMATLKALNTVPAPQQFNFRVAALQFRPGQNRTQYAYVFQAPTHDLTIMKDKDWAKVHVGVTALIRDENGKVVQKISKDIPYQVPSAKSAQFEQGVVSFSTPFFLPPGRYTVDTAAVDRQSMKASVRREVVVVEPSNGLEISDLALVRHVDASHGPADARDPLQSRGTTLTPELSDVITPDQDSKLRLYAVAYAGMPVDGPIDANLEILRNGQLVLRSPASVVPPDASGAASLMASLPAKDLPPGHYEAQVSFQYKGQTATRMLAFTVRPSEGTIH